VIDVFMHSSGYGPRVRWYGESRSSDGCATLVDVFLNWVARKWPRDGVAIIIRREP
jgi:hypothetical protein